MPRPLTESESQGRADAQKADIYFRNDFLRANKLTQKKTVELLETMSNLVSEGKQWDAQEFFFAQTNQHRTDDSDEVDWREVDDQIKHFCFSDHDMEGYTIVPRRIGQTLTVFRALMELSIER